MEKTTITVSRKTLRELLRLKKELNVHSYDELIGILVRDHKISNIKREMNELLLTKKEAEELKKVISGRRESWWRRSY